MNIASYYFIYLMVLNDFPAECVCVYYRTQHLTDARFIFLLASYLDSTSQFESVPFATSFCDSFCQCVLWAR